MELRVLWQGGQWHAGVGGGGRLPVTGQALTAAPAGRLGAAPALSHQALLRT